MVCNNYRRNSKLRLCTFHGFSYDNLEETVLEYIKKIFEDIDKLNEKISEEIYERLFKKLRDEAKQKENEYIEIKEAQDNSKQDDSENIKI